MTETATPVTYGKAETLGLDPADGKWAAVCNLHNVKASYATREQARTITKTPEAFCGVCGGQESPIVTFSAAQTDPVTEGQFESMNAMLEQASAEWLAEEKAKQNGTAAEPVIGTYMIGDTAHHVVAVSGMYVRTVCNPEHSVMSGGQTDDTESLCTYCMTGVVAPSQEVVERKRRGRPPKVAAEPVPAPEPQYPNLTEALLSATAELVAAVEQNPSEPDVVKALEILNPAMDTLRKHAPRRRIGTVTGARSGLVRQSQTVNPSDELEKVRAYADAGDKRAQDILTHVAAYVAGEDCSYCLSKGRSTRHGYATAFMSVGRELRAMEQRQGATAS